MTELDHRWATLQIEALADGSLSPDAERRMREIIFWPGEGDLGATGDLDLPRVVAAVGNGQAPHFDVVLGRDGDLELRLEVAIATAVGRFVELEDGFEI